MCQYYPDLSQCRKLICAVCLVGLRNTVENAMVLETGCPVDVADTEEDEMVRISEKPVR